MVFGPKLFLLDQSGAAVKDLMSVAFKPIPERTNMADFGRHYKNKALLSATHDSSVYGARKTKSHYPCFLKLNAFY